MKWNKPNIKKFIAADKPRKKEKIYTAPPELKYRQFGVYALWGLLILSLLMGFNGARNNGPAQALATPKEEPENAAATMAAGEFAKAFALDYFTWEPNAEGWEDRAARLAPDLAQGMDAQAGLLTSGQKWSSAATDAKVINIEENGPSSALITVAVNQTLSTAEKAQDKQHYLTVPVTYKNGLGVNGLPSFAAAPQQLNEQGPTLEGTPVEAKVENNLKNFLPTFFNSYVSDSADKLAYFLESDEGIKGLEGSLTFVEAQNTQIVQGQNANEFEVLTQAVLQDPKTGTGYTTAYRLTIKQDKTRYLVTKLNKGVE